VKHAELREVAPDTVFADLAYFSLGADVDSNHAQDAFDRVRMPVTDLRQYPGGFCLDEAGFMLLDAPSVVRHYDNEEAVRRAYYAQTEAIVMQATQAARVVAFDHAIRQDGATRVHADYTDVSGPARARQVLGDASAKLETRRYAIFSLWRPIDGPAEARPLAVAAADSIATDELVPGSAVPEWGLDDAYLIRHSDAHRWFYAPRQAPEEALLMKTYDSATDGRARFAAHAAMLDPDTTNDARPTVSIEARLLALFDD